VVERVHDLHDPRLADYGLVGDPARLREQGLLVAEGRFVVQRLLGQTRFRVRSVLLTPSAHRALQGDLLAGVTTFVAEPAVVETLTGFNFHRGCLAIAERPDDIAISALSRSRRLLALEGIGNPDNVGGVFRVAAAFAADGVILDGASVDPFYRKAVRTSMGSTLSLPFVRDRSWPAALDLLRDSGFRILALTPRVPAVPLNTVTVSDGDRIVVMAGAEGSGLSDAALARAELQVRIPIDPAVDSLNVTVAVGIALAALFAH
jgi:tRNA G18 (ribose-2'-O)-methylase SpoU